MSEIVLIWLKNNWRLVAYIGVIVSIFSFGYYKGYSNEHTKFQEHLNTDATAMAVAKAENERQLAQQKEITDRVTKEYADAVNKLNDYYKSHPYIVRLCDRPSATNTVSTKSEGTSGINKTSNGTPEAPATIEIDLRKAGQEVIQCQKLIQWELEQDRVQ